jgi:hypothetical protein
MKSRISDTGRFKQKRGSGNGKTYIPWIQVHDFSSLGLSTRVRGIKTGRTHHLLSRLETKVFEVLDFTSTVLDIKEQYPLLPINETVEIAKTSFLKHPSMNGRCLVMTSDFLVRLEKGHLALSIKYAKDINLRTLEKFEIERQYWEKRNIPWHIVTENEIPEILSNNVSQIRESWARPKTKLRDEFFLTEFANLSRKENTSVIEILKNLSKSYNESYENVKRLYLHFIYKKRIVFDYQRANSMNLMSHDYEVHC